MKKFTLFIAIVALVGCSQQDFSKLEKGTPAEDVIKAYGEPDEKLELFMGLECWRYSDNLITFFGDKVTDIKLDYDSAKIVMVEAKKGMKEVQESLDSLKKDLNINVETDIDIETDGE